MRTSAGRSVVVGISDGRESETALDWAVDEARLRGRSLHIVATDSWSESMPAGAEGRAALPSFPPTVNRAYERALERARNHLEGDVVTGELLPGRPIRALRDAAATAGVLVVGAREGEHRHSVSHAVAAHAACPVVVVRGERHLQPPGRVVVGVDGSVESQHAMTFAFEEAELRGAAVEAIQCTGAGFEDEAKQQLTESVVPYRAKHPDLAIDERVLSGRPVDELTARSDEVDLIVVGSRGRGRVLGALLGSVSQRLIEDARCPVTVVK
jgi:nucleotide-binding universal stress UspA family protein